MDTDTDDPAETAIRLEAALERIAEAATRRIIHTSGRAAEPGGSTVPPELTERLDAIIANLRAALAGKTE